MCEDVSLDNVAVLKYLGSLFAADGKQSYYIDARIAQAFARCGEFYSIFNSKSLNVALKLRLYEAAVCSKLTYGCETWILSDKAMGRLNGVNSRMIVRITGRRIAQEARASSCSFDLVKKVSQRRLRW